MVVAVPEKRRVRVIGAGALLWCQCTRGPSGTVYDGVRDPNCIYNDTEVLYDGPAGSGKTFYDCLRMHDFATRYPQFRGLTLRETRKSLSESVLPIKENYVCGPDHHILQRGGSREHRTSYTYFNGPPDPHGNPTEGAHEVLGGIDRIELYLSTEWDVVNLHEATNPRIREHHWLTLGTRMRGTGIPHPHCQYPDGIITDGEFKGMTTRDALVQTDRFAERISPDGRRKLKQGEDDYGTPLFFRQRVAECNPSVVEGKQHWLMQRWLDGKMARIVASHEDNPARDESYLAELRALPEPFRSIYYLGEWTTAEGLCWPSYDPKRHLIYGSFNRDPSTGRAWVTVGDWLDEHGSPKVFPITSVVAGFDWGIAHPGSIQVLAVAPMGGPRKIAFRIAEIVMSAQSIDWWAERVVELVEKFNIEAILCDPSAKAIWEHFNARLGPRHGRQVGGICQAADNTHKTEAWVQGGLDLVRTMFAQDRLFLLEDCHHGPIDQVLRMKRRPTGLAEEIPGYQLGRDKQNPDRLLPHPDKDRGCDDACDALRYVCMDVFKVDRDLKPKRIVAPVHLDPMISLSGAQEMDLMSRQELLRGPPRRRRY